MRTHPIALAILIAKLAFTQTAQQHIDHVTAGLLPRVILKDDPHPQHTLKERMAATHVPGVSISVIHGGVIEWEQGFGVTRIDGPPVTAETRSRQAPLVSQSLPWLRSDWCNSKNSPSMPTSTPA